MSIQAVGAVLTESKALGMHRLVLIGIANHVGSDGYGWCSQSQIALDAACSVRTVSRAVQSLVESGELVVVIRGHRLGNDRPQASVYQIQLPSLNVPKWQVEDSQHAKSGSQHDTAVSDQPSLTALEGDKSPSRKVKKPREPNPDWDALVEVSGYTPPPSQKSEFGRLARDLKAMRGDQEPVAYLRTAQRVYKETYPEAACTLRAVIKHAPQLMAEVSGALSPEQRVADNERWMKERGYA